MVGSVNSINQQGEWFSDLVVYKLTWELLEIPWRLKDWNDKQASISYTEMSYTINLLDCLKVETKILEEIHEGICGNHIGGKALALKALRAGFY